MTDLGTLPGSGSGGGSETWAISTLTGFVWPKGTLPTRHL